MNTPPPGVTAAPNRCSIRARILEVKQSSQYKDKWHLSLEILESTAIEGPNFAHVGKRVEAFAFDPLPPLSRGQIIVSEAEYIGGPKVGQFQLLNVRVES